MANPYDVAIVLRGAAAIKEELRSIGRSEILSFDLSGADLSGADLRRANLSRATLNSARLSSANLSRANLSGADLCGANLSGAILRAANLSRAIRPRSHASLSGSDLRGGNSDYRRKKSRLRSKGGGAGLICANLSGANLCGADLSGANLSGANLSGANLSGANLSGTNLTGTNLTGTNLTGTNLTGTNLSRANLDGVFGLESINSQQAPEVIEKQKRIDSLRSEDEVSRKLTIYIDPGSADSETIRDLFLALSLMYEGYGGSGLKILSHDEQVISAAEALA